MPDQDAVLAITSGTEDMQAVLNLVWEELLPAMTDATLSADMDTERKLATKLASLQLPPYQGQISAAMAQRVSGTQYDVDYDEDLLETISFEFGPETVYYMRRGGTDYRIPIGRDTWAISDQDEMGKIAASGAWESEDTYLLKIYYCETPYCSVQRFRFNEDLLVLDEEFNVSFGKRVRPQRTGTVR